MEKPPEDDIWSPLESVEPITQRVLSFSPELLEFSAECEKEFQDKGEKV